MLIGSDLVRGSIARWKKTKSDATVLASRLGEGDRSRHVSGRQRQTRLVALLDQAPDPIVARTLLERIIEGNDLLGVNYLAIGARRARSVCRIHLRNSAGRTIGFGTGFLVGPGVVMTNHHVISGTEDARYALAEFDYEYDADGVDQTVVAFPILITPPPIANQALDFCLVAVAPTSLDGKRSIEEFGWLPLNAAPGKAIVGEYLTIIQHPGGERKQVCVRENKLLKYDESGSTLWYKTDTVGGSSGSPVFNETWQVVAIHHSGVPATDAQGRWLTIDGKVWDSSMDETRVKWIANEGIRISSIVQFLAANHASDTLAHSVVLPDRPPPDPRARHDERTANAGASSEVVGDELRLTIPVRVSVRLDAGRTNGTNGNGARSVVQTNGAAPAVARPTPPLLLPPADGLEKIVVDQSNYDKRPGYDPNFLGKGKLSIPLPTVARAALKKKVLTFGPKRTSELKYWNYSVVMHRERRLAIVSAINVDGSLRKGTRDKDGDRWYSDTRIEGFQLEGDFYGQQREFEADRSKNPFDRGHLSARSDAQWGATTREAKRNGDDSYHWSNCAPQHHLFNQGKKLWQGLEEYVIDNFAADSDRRASVFNGPVFDAPLGTIGEDGRPIPSIDGKLHKDPTFGDVAIPKLFFKVVACVRRKKLATAAFLMSQEDLLATIDRLQGLPPLPQEKLTQAEAKVFQVSLAHVAKLTGLDFGSLAEADTIGDELLTARARPIERLQHVAL